MQAPRPEDITVCIFGQHEVGYPRNVCVQDWLTRAGFSLKLCHSRIAPPLRTASLLRQYLRIWREVDVVYATEGSHTHIPYLKVLTRLTRKPLIFDPFLSRYNTRVEDRKLYAPGSFQAFVAKMHDSLACRAADVLVFDTKEHLEYFASRYDCDKPRYVLEVGVNEQRFRRLERSSARENGIVEVLFYGTYIPLHGVDTILHAAHQLRDNRKICFKLIGAGQTYQEMRALAATLGLTNVEFLEPVSEVALLKHVARADLCLGIFAQGPKPGQVVPNKVIQCAACEKPIVTRTSTAVKHYFTNQENIALVPEADPDALAQSIAELANDPAKRSQLARGARAVYETRFSQELQVKKIRKIVFQALGRG